MPNWCRNEVKFHVYSFDNSDLILEEVKDFLKETIPNFNRRVDRAHEAEMRRVKESNAAGRQTYYSLPESTRKRVEFDFNNLIPYPEEFRQRDEDWETLTREEFVAKYGNYDDGFNSGGYKWCVNHWGTKWGAVLPVWVMAHQTLHFDTAWAPGIKLISELHKRFPDLHMSYEYYESGSAMIGGCEFIPEKDWDGSDYSVEEVHSLEQYRNRDRSVTKWEAGKAYNPWSTDYMGFKGG